MQFVRTTRHGHVASTDVAGRRLRRSGVVIPGGYTLSRCCRPCSTSYARSTRARCRHALCFQSLDFLAFATHERFSAGVTKMKAVTGVSILAAMLASCGTKPLRAEAPPAFVPPASTSAPNAAPVKDAGGSDAAVPRTSPDAGAPATTCAPSFAAMRGFDHQRCSNAPRAAAPNHRTLAVCDYDDGRCKCFVADGWGGVGDRDVAHWYCAKKIKACPGTFAEASSLAGACASGSPTQCSYPKGGCWCGRPPTGIRLDPRVPASWRCETRQPGCPYPAPVAGSKCRRAGTTCEYHYGRRAHCEKGRWAVSVPLPPP